jgi:hypothetical protein
VLLTTAAFETTALAEPTPEERATARAFMDEGDAKMAAKAYEPALKAYERAHDLVKVPTTGLEVGRALAALGRLMEARDALLWVTRVPARPGEPPVFQEARSEAAALIEAINARIPSVRIRITGLRPGVVPEVAVDGGTPRATPLPAVVPMDPGQRVIDIRAPGHSPARVSIDLREGERAEATAALRPERLIQEEAPSGEAPARGAPWIQYLGLSIAGGGLAVGAIAGGFSLAAASRAESQCPLKPQCPPSAEGDINTSLTLANVSNAGFGAAILGAGIFVYGLVVVVEGSKPEPPRATGAPYGKPGTLGAKVALGLTPSGFRINGEF